MIETIKNCYCDVLTEHNGQKVSGASTYKDISIMVYDMDSEQYVIEKRTIDMCPACYAKYRINLAMSYDYRGQPFYTFIEEQPSASP